MVSSNNAGREKLNPADCGYQTPTEESHPPFFTPTPSPSRPNFFRHASYASRPDVEQETANANGTADGPGSNLTSLDNMLHKADTLPRKQNVSIKDRIGCYQWTFFTMTMVRHPATVTVATGGIANAIHVLPFRSTWLDITGIIFFLFNLCLFLINCICISIRFYLRPATFIDSFTDQVESLFIPSFVVSIAIIFINICEYGVPNTGPWLLRAMEVMFWIYVTMSVVASSSMYLILWSTLVFPIHMMTPTWVFPAYPMLLTAPFAGNLLASAKASGYELTIDSTSVALCAITAQGTGCLIAFMISAAFIYRLMTQKLPRDFQRPGVFISIGPFGFTVAGIVQLGAMAEEFIPDEFMGTPSGQAVGIVKVTSVMVGLWLWGLSFWFFLVSVGSLWKYVMPDHKMPFRMTWWSFVFPNTALVTATAALGKAFGNHGLQVFACVTAAALIIVWTLVFLYMLKGLKNKELLWPRATS